jgi:ATP-grasp domain
MNVLFVSPSFPPQFFRFCAALRARGVNALGLGDTPPHELHPELGAALTDYAYVPGLAGDDDAALRAVGWLISRHGRIDRIESHNEYWLGLDARLREDFNVWGPKPAQLSRWRFKSTMAELFDAAGVPRPEGAVPKTREEVQAYARRHGYPLVFKPNQGVGAASTFRVDSDAELAAALERPLVDTIVQPFIQGDIVSYDGLVDRQGRIVFETSHVYSGGIMEVLEDNLDLWYVSAREIPAQLKEYGRRTVAAFGLLERFFHIEFFRLPDGTHRALECNVRPPGGFTTDMMNYTADIDVYALWARVVSGDDCSGFSWTPGYHVAHVSRRHGRHYRLGVDEIRARLGERLLFYREMPPVLAGAMGDFVFMIRSPELAQVKADLALIQALA